MPTLRCFLAAEIGPNVAGRAQTLINKLKATTARVAWVKPGQLHFTLGFLGDVATIEIPGILTAMKNAVREIPCFDLIVRGLGVFPSLDNPRTIWLGVTLGADEMRALHSAVEQSLRTVGVKGEGRRFRPHLTIGRVKSLPHGAADLRALITEYEQYEAGLMTVDQVTLLSSDLHASGPMYEPLGEAELCG